MATIVETSDGAAINRDLRRIAAWIVALHLEVPRLQIKFQLMQTIRRIKRIENDAYLEIHQDILAIIKEIDDLEHTVEQRLIWAEKLTALCYRVL